MTTTTGRPTTKAASTRPEAFRDGWQNRSACRNTDGDPFFSDRTRTQERAQGVCRGCPVRSHCLTDILDYETGNYRWGVVGGLTELQRRALRCEALLGNRPNLRQAGELAAPWWTARMMPLRHRGLSPREIAVELRRHGVLASAVTVRLAVWWAGGKGGVLPRRRPGDTRMEWQIVRDECRDIVEELRGLGANTRDVAAYLQVPAHVLTKAIKAWARQAEEVLAA